VNQTSAKGFLKHRHAVPRLQGCLVITTRGNSTSGDTSTPYKLTHPYPRPAVLCTYLLLYISPPTTTPISTLALSTRMIQAPIDYEPDPEPDIRRFSSSNQPPQEQPRSQSAYLDTDNHHGVPDPQIERPQPAHPASHAPDAPVYDEKSTEYAAGADVTPSSTADSINQEKAAIAPNNLDVPVTRPTSNRPKVRDFAVNNIAQPIRRATEKLVPAKRDGPPDVAFALPPDLPRREGSPNSAARREKRKLPSPTYKESFIVRCLSYT
jgi:hypothetical protein